MATKFTVMTVDEFDAYLKQTDFNRVVQLIQNHHTMVPSYSSFNGDNHMALLKGMEDYHVIQRGFSQIAQNLTSFPDGKIALCRPLEKIPAGCVGANQGGICIEHLGNFDTGKDSMRAEHRATIVKMNVLLCREFHLIPSTDSIVYHHWYDLTTGQRTNNTKATKSCPGSAFFGGNTIADCKTNFIPLVLDSLASMAPAAPVPAAIWSAVVTASSLNVRNGAGSDATVVKSLSKGVVVQVYEEKSGWCRVHPTQQHWVSGKFLQLL